MRSLHAVAAVIAGSTLLSMPVLATEAYGGLGTTGFELGLAFKVGPSTGLRANGEFLKLSHKFEDNGATYDTQLKFASVGLYGDYFLTENFRFTGGALVGSRKVSGKGVSTSGQITVNGTTYNVPGESVSVDAKLPSVSPYLGLGFGHGQASEGLGFYIDAGAVFGRAKVKLTPSAGLLATAGQANVDAEEAKLQEKANRYRAYPAIKLGISYSY